MKLSAVKRIVEERKMDMEIIVNNKVSKRPREVLNKILYGESLPSGSNLVPFYIPLFTDRKRAPFIYFLLTNGTPFTYQFRPFRTLHPL